MHIVVAVVVVVVVVVEQRRQAGFAGYKSFHKKSGNFGHKQVGCCKCSGRKAGRLVGRPGTVEYKMEYR